MSKQGLSNKTKSYKPMIKSYWTSPDLTTEQRKNIRQAAAYMRKAISAKPGETIRIDIDNLDKL